jgi:hypothetical protein
VLTLEYFWRKKSKDVAALLTAYIYLQLYFDDVLASSSEPVAAVLENVGGDWQKLVSKPCGFDGDVASHCIEKMGQLVHSHIS